MTRNQIEYWRLVAQRKYNDESIALGQAQLRETIRSNKARESETARSNLAREAETQRSNRANELQTRVNADRNFMLDLQKFRETQKTNDRNYRVANKQLAEQERTNKANEAIKRQQQYLAERQSVLQQRQQAEVERSNRAKEQQASLQYYENRNYNSRNLSNELLKINETRRANQVREAQTQQSYFLSSRSQLETQRHNIALETEQHRKNTLDATLKQQEIGINALRTISDIGGKTVSNVGRRLIK